MNVNDKQRKGVTFHHWGISSMSTVWISTYGYAWICECVVWLTVDAIFIYFSLRSVVVFRSVFLHFMSAVFVDFPLKHFCDNFHFVSTFNPYNSNIEGTKWFWFDVLRRAGYCFAGNIKNTEDFWWVCVSVCFRYNSQGDFRWWHLNAVILHWKTETLNWIGFNRNGLNEIPYNWIG